MRQRGGIGGGATFSGWSYVDLCIVVILEARQAPGWEMCIFGIPRRFTAGSWRHLFTFRGIIELQTYKLIYKSIPVLRSEVDKILRY
jgi:hypothetical protein